MTDRTAEPRHGFARETDLAACRCGDWHPIAYLAHLPEAEAAAPAGLDVEALALAFVGRNWGWVDWATKEMAMEAEPSDRAREAVWNAANTLAERYARLLQGKRDTQAVTGDE